jgi:hypothetical protein
VETIVNVESTVPGLEGRSAREGTANAAFIGAANHWHRRAKEAEAKLLADRTQVAFVSLVIGFAAGFATHLLWVMS